MMLLFLVTVVALGLAGFAIVAAWAAQSWLVLFAGLGGAWLAFALGLYSSMPGHPRRFGQAADE